MRNSTYQRLLRTTLLIVLGIAAGTALPSGTTVAGERQGDRFGIRGGIWPQSDIVGTFGTRRIYPDGDSLRIGIDEPAQIVPFVELYGLFHLGSRWWAEGSVGWSTRTKIQVGGFGRVDTPGLGEGRVDFFPLSVGLRAIWPYGPDDHPHNVYARGGGSLVFANESPSLVHDSVLKYDIYHAGTEGAFGFLGGVGSEYYISKSFAAVLDVSYRYTRFTYATEAKFDLSALWLAVGITLKTR